MCSKIEDEEKFTKYFLFTLMAEKKVSAVYKPDISYYKIGSVIGKSSFASTVIYAGQYIRTNELVALKKYNIESLTIGEIKLIQREFDIASQIVSPYILSPSLSFVKGNQVICISPLIEYGSCSDLIRKNFHGGLPEIIINFILKDVLLALQFLHSKGIIHRAVKASHILVGFDGHAKLSGFRYAYKKQNESTLLRRLGKVYEFPPHSESNLKWLSPDILQQNLNGYNEKSDIYSLGLTVCELANGVAPYSNVQLTTMLMEKINGEIPVIYDESTIDKLNDSLDESFVDELKDCYVTKKFSKHLHSFKDLCCLLRPEERPDTCVLLLHPLFSSVGKRSRLFSSYIIPAVPITEKNFVTVATDLEISSGGGNHQNFENFPDWEF